MRSQQNAHNVGLYCRLSRDDGNDGPSMSIENQKQLLLDYVAERGWTVYDIYVDDGLTGTNFERPNFKRMKQDIEDGKIDCVITKDLSRLGRNFVQTGYYTDEYFLERGVRYIAINDGIDTANEDNDMAGFYHVMNEFYPKQVSKKVKQVKKAATKQGKFIGSYAPYGYKKSPEDKHKLIIDAETAPIARRIFKEFASGENARCIADNLTREQIDSPRFRFYRASGKIPPHGLVNAWLSSTIYQMLRNQVYIGNMAQGKRVNVSFKTKQRRAVPKEDWIIIPDTHEPLVDKDTWDIVQKRASSNNLSTKRLNRTGKPSLFSSIIKCACCGANLAYTEKEMKSGGATGRYRCQSYLSKGKAVCTSHTIYDAMLTQVVLNDIKHYAYLTEDERFQVASTLKGIKGGEERESGEKLRRRLREIDHRLGIIATAFKKLYEDRVSGIIPDDMFRDMMSSYTSEKDQLQKEHDKISGELETHRDVEQDISAWLELVAKHEEISVLDRNTVLELIESIEVQETFDTDGQRHLEIWINYRFIGRMPNKTEKNALHGVPHGLIAS
ncbi:MAG: recombinase family protein [Oscillospiraceae bacterium]|nr:recombinase family protein [Oscillospiraceae bacterium]